MLKNINNESKNKIKNLFMITKQYNIIIYINFIKTNEYMILTVMQSNIRV